MVLQYVHETDHELKQLQNKRDDQQFIPVAIVTKLWYTFVQKQRAWELQGNDATQQNSKERNHQINAFMKYILFVSSVSGHYYMKELAVKTCQIVASRLHDEL